MPKNKTHKATSKRITFSKRRKAMVRQAGQDHFNARESGKTTVGKRRDRQLSATNSRGIRTMIPYFRKRS